MHKLGTLHIKRHERSPMVWRFLLPAAVILVSIAAGLWIGMWATVATLAVTCVWARRITSGNRNLNHSHSGIPMPQEDSLQWHRNDPADPLWTLGWTRSRH